MHRTWVAVGYLVLRWFAQHTVGEGIVIQASGRLVQMSTCVGLWGMSPRSGQPITLGSETHDSFESLVHCGYPHTKVMMAMGAVQLLRPLIGW